VFRKYLNASQQFQRDAKDMGSINQSNTEFLGQSLNYSPVQPPITAKATTKGSPRLALSSVPATAKHS
jgi:hypothetical protein